MTNKTYWKYVNIYSANRQKNELFDKWLGNNYIVYEGHEVWDYSETFEDILTGEKIYSEAIIMQKYIKEKNPYFRDFCHFDKWLDSDMTQEEFFSVNHH